MRRLGALQGFFTTAARGSGEVTKHRRLGRSFLRSGVHGQAPTGHSRTLREVVAVRAVSIVEAYLFDLVERQLSDTIAKVEADVRGENLIDHLVAHRWQPIAQSGAWARLVEFAKQGLGFNPKQFDGWQELDLLRETRHAVVHRVGEVTPKYLEAAEKVGRLRALGLEPAKVTGSVPLDDVHVLSDLALCRRFVLWFDGMVRQATG